MGAPTPTLSRGGYSMTMSATVPEFAGLGSLWVTSLFMVTIRVSPTALPFARPWLPEGAKLAWVTGEGPPVWNTLRRYVSSPAFTRRKPTKLRGAPASTGREWAPEEARRWVE